MKSSRQPPILAIRNGLGFQASYLNSMRICDMIIVLVAMEVGGDHSGSPLEHPLTITMGGQESGGASGMEQGDGVHLAGGGGVSDVDVDGVHLAGGGGISDMDVDGDASGKSSGVHCYPSPTEASTRSTEEITGRR